MSGKSCKLLKQILHPSASSVLFFFGLTKIWTFQALLSLCSDEMVSARSAMDLCINQMKNVLSSQQVPKNSSMEMIGRAYRATETFVQVMSTITKSMRCAKQNLV